MNLARTVIVVSLLLAASPLSAAADTSAALPVTTWLAQAPADYFSPDLDNIREDMAAGNFSRALETLPSTLAKRAARPDKTYLLKGLSEYSTGDFSAAAASLRRSLQTKPSSSDTLFFLSLAQQAAGNPEQALQSAEEALWFNRFSWVKADDAMYQQGLLLSLKPDAVKAITVLAQAVKSNPQSSRARVLLARLQHENGNRAEAIRVLREGTALRPDDPSLRLALSKALVNGADRKLNKSDIEEGVKLAAAADSAEDSKDSAAAYIKSLIAAGSLEAASEKMAAAAKRFPGDSDLETLRKQLSIEKDAQAAASSTPRAGV